MHADPRLVVFLYIRLLSYAYFLKSLQSYNDYNLYPNFLAKKFHRHAKKVKKSQNERTHRSPATAEGAVLGKERRRLACETLGVGNFLRGRVNAALAWSAGVLACETPGVGNFLRGRVNAAQPGNRRRRFAPQRAQASSPAKRSALVTFSCASDYYRLHNRRRRDACFLCFAERLKAMARHSLRGLLWQNYHRLHNRRRRDACVLCFAERLKAMARLRSGGDYGENYLRLHNRRRRDACVLCFAKRLRRWPGSAVGATTAKITTAYTTTQARRLRSLLCRAPKGDGHASAVGATLAKITTACTTDAGETPAFHASAVGATLVNITDACTTDDTLSQKKSKFNRLI